MSNYQPVNLHLFQWQPFPLFLLLAVFCSYFHFKVRPRLVVSYAFFEFCMAPLSHSWSKGLVAAGVKMASIMREPVESNHPLTFCRMEKPLSKDRNKIQVLSICCRVLLRIKLHLSISLKFWFLYQIRMFWLFYLFI